MKNKDKSLSKFLKNIIFLISDKKKIVKKIYFFQREILVNIMIFFIVLLE